MATGPQAFAILKDGYRLMVERSRRKEDAVAAHVQQLQAQQRAGHDLDLWLRVIKDASNARRLHVTRIFFLYRQERNNEIYVQTLSKLLGPLFSVKLISTWRQNPQIQVSWTIT